MDGMSGFSLPHRSSPGIPAMSRCVVRIPTSPSAGTKQLVDLLGSLSDSKSALQTLWSKGWTNPLILQLLEQHHFLSTLLAKTIHFCWIPSHVGIKGNDLPTKLPKMLPMMILTNDDPSSLPGGCMRAASTWCPWVPGLVGHFV